MACIQKLITLCCYMFVLICSATSNTAITHMPPPENNIGIRPPQAPVQIGTMKQYIPHIIFALAASGLIYLLISRIKKQKNKPAQTKPLFVLLKNLTHAKQIIFSDTYTFASTLICAMKQFIDNKYHIPCTTLTSEEWMKSFKQHTYYTHDLHLQLQELLHAFDDVVFAGRQMNLHQKQQLFIKTCQFLRNFHTQYQSIYKHSTPSLKP